MSLAQAPSIIGALLMLALGIVWALRPGVLEGLGVTASSALGKTEIRAVFGGMFIAVGVVCLATQHPYAYLAAGAMWFGDAFVRAFAILVDRPRLSQGLTALGVGILLGGLLVSGFWTM